MVKSSMYLKFSLDECVIPFKPHSLSRSAHKHKISGCISLIECHSEMRALDHDNWWKIIVMSLMFIQDA